MEIYQTDEEQVDAIKEWWDQNGKSVIVGLVIVLGSVFGWNKWNEHQQGLSASASSRYEMMMAQVEKDPDGAVAMGESLKQEFKGSHYSVLAAMMTAKIEVDRGQLEIAAAELSWAAEQSGNPIFVDLANSRLARVILAQGRADDALAMLAKVKSESFSGIVAEIEGDAYISQGDRTKARGAYQKALAGYADTPNKRSLVQIKLDDLNEVLPTKM
ncbi:MAG: tetratricopeptide repeat protein [Gammaproteobacteria bacterium]|nr:tetratricopeptide repeat protein [Gammaproteobacteria bacterium]